MFLKVTGFLFLLSGTLTVLASRWIVNKFSLDKNVASDFEDELTDEELKDYKRNKALVNIKLVGMLLALPGFIIILIAYG